MAVDSIKLVSFSPTGTTKKVLQSIADGIGIGSVETIDISAQKIRERPLETSANDLLIIGVPVYMGRIPALLNTWFESLKADATPTVCVVVYGNRAFEDSLLELKDRITASGGKPIAGAAYIGEHSFSTAETPTAHGRPDADDLAHAEAFGAKIRQKLDSLQSNGTVAELNIPGNHPYGGKTVLWDVDFIAVDEDKCADCGVCADICPVGAIDADNSGTIDIVKCITCCACIKSCPEGARSVKAGPIMDARNRLNNLFSAPQQPECFI